MGRAMFGVWRPRGEFFRDGGRKCGAGEESPFERADAEDRSPHRGQWFRRSFSIGLSRPAAFRFFDIPPGLNETRSVIPVSGATRQ